MHEERRVFLFMQSRNEQIDLQLPGLDPGLDPKCEQPRFDATVWHKPSEQNLARLVADSVEEAVGTNGETHVSTEWKLLLGAVTYLYARGIYSSEEIEAGLECTSLGLKLERLSSAQAIRELRRYHRTTLEACLRSVLQKTCPTPFATTAAIEWKNPADEAKARIDRAIRLDSYALDF